MSCPTCSHTLIHLTSAHGMKFYWCPRCGTLKTECAAGHDDVSTPTLVERCRTFEEADLRTGDFPPFLHAWAKLGIHESIHPEGER